ncbi:MAG: LacI family DNA-binding transcriptional regulator [Blautia faecis]
MSGRMYMGATLNDIAKKVGVSQSTVSRVINGTAPISDEMKNKVYKAMKSLIIIQTALHETLRKESPLRSGWW